MLDVVRIKAKLMQIETHWWLGLASLLCESNEWWPSWSPISSTTKCSKAMVPSPKVPLWSKGWYLFVNYAYYESYYLMKFEEDCYCILWGITLIYNLHNINFISLFLHIFKGTNVYYMGCLSSSKATGYCVWVTSSFVLCYRQRDVHAMMKGLRKCLMILQWSGNLNRIF